MSTAPYSLKTKSAVDKKRHETLKSKLEEMKILVKPLASSQEEVMYEAVRILTGQLLEVPPPVLSDCGKSPREVLQEREQRRRNQKALAYDALNHWIVSKNLATPKEGKPLPQIQILQVTLDYLRKHSELIPQSSPVETVKPISYIDEITKFLAADIENLQKNLVVIQKAIEEINKQKKRQPKSKRQQDQ